MQNYKDIKKYPVIVKPADSNSAKGVKKAQDPDALEKYAKEASDRLVYLMKNCAPELGVPFKCDPTVERHWYEEEYIKNIKKESESGKSFEELLQNHPEITENVLKKYLHSGSDVL